MEKLAVSKATKFLFKVSSRDIYEFPDTNDHAHMLLQDSTAMDTFPIVLIGK